MAAEEPVFGCSLTLHRDESGRKCMGYFGREASSHVNQSTLKSPSNNFRPEAIRLLQDHMNNLIEEIQPDSIDYLDPVCCGVMSPVTQLLLEKGAIPRVQQAQIIDLSVSQRELRRSMTKSCRAMVEWGIRNLDIEVISGEQFGVALGEQAETIAASDRLACEALNKTGNGFLVQGRLKGELVSNGLFVHNRKTCHLVWAEKKSTSPDRPVLHALIWQAMQQSKNLQCNKFDFGNSTIGSSHLDAAVDAEFSATCFGGKSHNRLRVTLNRMFA